MVRVVRRPHLPRRTLADFHPAGGADVTRLKTGILIFNDVEVLDFCGPFEVFSVTRLDQSNRREQPSPFDVFLVAETADTNTTTGGMRVLPSHSFESCPQLDLVVVPGGYG